MTRVFLVEFDMRAAAGRQMDIGRIGSLADQQANENPPVGQYLASVD
jgi:hypothetical protein